MLLHYVNCDIDRSAAAHGERVVVLFTFLLMQLNISWLDSTSSEALFQLDNRFTKEQHILIADW